MKAKQKREAGSLPGSAKKRLKIFGASLDDLPWKSVARSLETALDGDDGVLELQEVDGVEVAYEDTARGRVAKFNVCLASSESRIC